MATSTKERPSPDIESNKPYSVFTRQHRLVITTILGLSSIASPLSANIYLPLLPTLRTTYHVSEQDINLTITLYVVVAALAPAFFAPTADQHGRRPVALATYTIFTLASLGLGLNDAAAPHHRSYAALLLLRALSALGAAACASLTYGVVSDVCVPAERGTMIGPAVSAANVGTVLGPVVGGVIAWATGGAAWVFFLLALFGAMNLLLMGLFLPETARTVVGDGSEGKRARMSGWREIVVLGSRWGQKQKTQSVEEEPDPRNTIKQKTGFPNPLKCLTIILSKDTALVLWLAGCNYAAWYCITAAIPQIFAHVYGWSTLDVGLAYLPSALTIFACGFVTGPWNNYKYRKTAREMGVVLSDNRHVDIAGFPIEKARARQLWPCFCATHLMIAGVGWAVQQRAHPAVTLVLLAGTGFVQSTLFFAFNTLLVDIHPDRPSTASAAASLVRSGLSGVGVAVLQPLVNAVGWGWYTTILALVIGIPQGVGMIVLLKWGQSWRETRRATEEQKKRDEEST